MTLKQLFTLDNLNKATYQCVKASKWKDTTQRYQANMLIKNLSLMEDILNGDYTVSNTNNFIINERGKRRSIEAPNIRDRVVQKVLCTHVLIPQLTKYLIYDNYASLKDRGTSFARKRVDIMLRNYIKQYGSNGWVLKIDIKKYFDSINHDVLKKLVKEKIEAEQDVLDFIDYIVDTSSKTDTGLNLGSEAPQILAVFYLNRIDQYIKTVKSIKYYGRYMDDMIIIGNSKEELHKLLNEIKMQLTELKLEVNQSKTQICKLSRGFTFMQIKYKIDGNKIIKIPTHSKIVRERRRLKKYKHLKDEGRMTEEDISNCYKSWKYGILKDCNRCFKSIQNMDRLYNSLFDKIKKKGKRNRYILIDEIFKKEIELYEAYCNYRQQQLCDWSGLI